MKDTGQRIGGSGTPPPLPHPQAQPLVQDVHPTVPGATSIKADEMASDAKNTTEFRWKYAESVHKYVREYIELADKKAGFFFTVASALMAVLYNKGYANQWIEIPTMWSFTDTLSAIAIGGLIICISACIGTVIPRRRGSKRGIIFYDAITEFESSQEYVGEILAKTPDELVGAKLSHIRDIAAVCSRKYNSLRVAAWSGAVGAYAALLLLLLSKSSNY